MGEADNAGEQTVGRPRRGLGIAAVAIGASGLTLTTVTWIAWFVVRPGLVDGWQLSWVSQVFLLMLGALWFALLPLSVLGLVFSGYSRHRAGATLAAVTLLLSLLGAGAFATTNWRHIGPPVAYFDTTGR